MHPSRILFLGVLVGAVALAAPVWAEGVGKVSGTGPAQAVSAGEVSGSGPAVGEYVVVHYLTWLHRSPEEGAERWADNRTRADNQTEYLVFRVTGVRDGWLEVESLSLVDAATPGSACYSSLTGMADLGLRLWIRDDKPQRVTTTALELPQDDGSHAQVSAGVVVEPGEVHDGTQTATLREYGLSLPVQLPADRVGASYRPDPLPRGEPGAWLALAPQTAVRFAGSPVDLEESVAILWLRSSTTDAVKVVTSCGRYRFLRDQPGLTVSAADGIPSALVTEGSSASSLDGVGMMMIGTIGDGHGSVADLLAGDDGTGIAFTVDPVIPTGTAMTWPDGQPAGRLPRELLLFGAEPVGEADGNPCYSRTLGMFACDGCADNVTLCFAVPTDP